MLSEMTPQMMDRCIDAEWYGLWLANRMIAKAEKLAEPESVAQAPAQAPAKPVTLRRVLIEGSYVYMSNRQTVAA